MNSAAFRAALRATARVALGVTAAGCGGSVAAAPEAGADSGSGATFEAAAGSTDAATEDAGVTPDSGPAADALACSAPPESDLLPEALHADAGAGIDQATFDCCVARVAAFATGDATLMAGELPDAGTTGTDVASCCAAIVARLDYEERNDLGVAPDASPWVSDERASADVHWACCAAVGEPEGPTCTPWGPPTPPAMPRRLLEVA